MLTPMPATKHMVARTTSNLGKRRSTANDGSRPYSLIIATLTVLGRRRIPVSASTIKIVPAVGLGRALQAVQAQGELDLQSPVWLLPVGAEQLGDPVQAL